MKLKLPTVLVLLLCCQFTFAFNGKDSMLTKNTLVHSANKNEILLEDILVASYLNCLQITDEPSKVSGTSFLIDFPMHVDINDPSIRNSSNGLYMENPSEFDIRFTMECGIFLEHQIGFYADTKALTTDNNRSLDKKIIYK